jgi:DNA-binding response OmpR family regulator
MMHAKRILLVEDEREVANMLGIALRSEGYEVVIADTALRARLSLGSDGYDLVIADYRLPDGDGIDIADEAAGSGIKTLVVSAYLFQAPASRLEKHELLMKPARPQEIIDAVRGLVG